MSKTVVFFFFFFFFFFAPIDINKYDMYFDKICVLDGQ